MSDQEHLLHVDADGETSDADERRHLLHIIEHAAHLLPAQGPITVFVHHNTLHAFEDLSFDEAVRQGARTFGCNPYLTEDRYHCELERGRIRREDLAAMLIDDLGDGAEQLLGFLGTRYHLRSAMLEQPFLFGPTEELRWFIKETDALRRFRQEVPESVRERVIRETRHWVMRDLRVDELDQAEQPHVIHRSLSRLFQQFDEAAIENWTDAKWEAFTLHLLWWMCRHGARNYRRVGFPNEAGHRFARHRDLLLGATGEDSDQLVHDVLIRFCAAFGDQGFADWTLPSRDRGFMAAFQSLFGSDRRLPDQWLRKLPDECRRIDRGGLGPLDSILRSLEILNVPRNEWTPFVSQSLFALRGWAGMLWQLETRGDRAAIPVPQGTLVEFLAARLMLDRLALAHIARESLGYRGSLSELRETLSVNHFKHDSSILDKQAFLVFQLAQVRGWTPKDLYELPERQWTTLLDEIDAFPGLERRRIFHNAYERRYRIETLDALAANVRMARQGGGKSDAFAFQVVCCIDEREESFRRHLEETAPDCETFGAAGFFSVAMYYRGAAHAHYVPLCPVVIRPLHFVSEEAAYTLEHAARRRKQTRRALGTLTHRAHVGSRTLAGGWLAAVVGSVTSIPLVVRILFPRVAAQLLGMLGSFTRPPMLTRLELERLDEPPSMEEGHVGFNVGEMAAIVERLLREIGLTGRFARLVFIVGHGSSSLNNPHEAAHDCGACGGGRGGPNARAFAQMANDPRVRELLVQRGLNLPRHVVFIGAYHNTCDDDVVFYDLDRLPRSHRSDFEQAREVFDKARRWNAHERCRRFESSKLSMSADEALRHVEGRAEDLSQVRPEFGHATNALCFIGRREWSREMFLDRRAFLQSYDPAQDDQQHTILKSILQAVIPVCVGINLEYYFSNVDPTGYGCGTKLPHNITSLLGVMNGAGSDLLPGLPWQMVEIHEPMRLLIVVEAAPSSLTKIMQEDLTLSRLCHGRWLQLAAFDATTAEIHVLHQGRFEAYRPASNALSVVGSSLQWYRGWRDHLGFARIQTPQPSVSSSN